MKSSPFAIPAKAGIQCCGLFSKSAFGKGASGFSVGIKFCEAKFYDARGFSRRSVPERRSEPHLLSGM
jgi:hypothetical protein